MKNILTTIPKGKFSSWEHAERICRKCDGTTEWDGPESEWFWLINTMNLPKFLSEDGVCFMVYDGLVRGYFNVIDTDLSKNWGRHCETLPERETKCIIMANWHPLDEPISQRGFQGWRYTDLQP